MKKPKKFEPCPQWGIMSQKQLDEAVNWIFEVLLAEPEDKTTEK